MECSTRPSNVRVCQFRHFRVRSLENSIIIPHFPRLVNPQSAIFLKFFLAFRAGIFVGRECILLFSEAKEKADSSLNLLMRKTGLEPVWNAPHAPQTCASASSATSAYRILASNTRFDFVIIPLRRGFVKDFREIFFVNPCFFRGIRGIFRFSLYFSAFFVYNIEV